MASLPHLWAVIPSGGAGTRLWPLSRAASPKFLHDLTGTGSSLLQTTVERLLPIVGDRVLVVTGQGHAEAVSAQLPQLPPGAIIVEPAPRDSMAAIGLAAALLERRDPDAVLGSFAADHVVSDHHGFSAGVELAERVAREGWLVTIGVEATYPATGFGYIRLGEPLAGHPGVCEVRQFVEKPSAEVATEYCATGDYRWNAGMFLVRPGVLLDLLAEGHPRFAATLRRIAADPPSVTDLWPTLPRLSVDHAVAEPAADAGRVAVVPAAFGWEDIGDFSSLRSILGTDQPGLTVLGDPTLVHALDASGLVVPRADRVVAVIGLDDVVVIDTGDALLVTTTERAQDVKAIVVALEAAGRGHLT